MGNTNNKWELAPAYDVCYSYDPTNIWVNQQTLSINGKHRNINKSDFASEAKVESDMQKDIQGNLHILQ